MAATRATENGRRLLQALEISDAGEPSILAAFAHPDDEAIGMGGHLGAFPDLVLVHVTDGAPRDMRDARAHGFATRAAYAQARREELALAAAEAGLDPSALLHLGVADQEAAWRLAFLARRLAALVARHAPAALFIHAYEGGHPDHDAVAFAAHAAVRLLRARNRAAPALVEMPFYRAEQGAFVAQAFAPEPAVGSIVVELDSRACAVKEAMFARHRSQKQVLAPFQTKVERFRRAPDYDFAKPPNAGDLYYARFPWGMDGASWATLAQAALDALGLPR